MIQAIIFNRSILIKKLTEVIKDISQRESSIDDEKIRKDCLRFCRLPIFDEQYTLNPEIFNDSFFCNERSVRLFNQSDILKVFPFISSVHDIVIRQSKSLYAGKEKVCSVVTDGF